MTAEPMDDLLRRGLGRMPVGVAVITTRDGDRPHGSTGMAWAESADPPLVLTTLKADGSTARFIRDSGVFGVSLLSEDQRDLVYSFAGRAETRFDGVATSTGVLGVPLLEGCTATFECEVENVFPFGAYEIVVGRVVSTGVGPSGARPIVHYDDSLWRVVTDESVSVRP